MPPESFDRLPIRRALLSVSDKSGLIELGQALVAAGVTLVSTGGTARALRDAKLDVTDVSAVTGFPEILDGRVKTLHPGVHAGLLAEQHNPDHMAALRSHDIAAFDLLVVNLYPFEAALAAASSPSEMIENIDIGGPAMLRAAAKNHSSVAVVTDTEDYALIHAAVREGGTTLAQRRQLAANVYARTAAYDSLISQWFANWLGDALPRRVTISGRQAQSLRYGENPHQIAGFYASAGSRPGVGTARQLQGKALSYNNLNDADAAIELVAEFRARPAVAIIKHANPCGVAEAGSLIEAYRAALACDPVSAFGGIIAVNQPLDAETAEEIARLFTEVVIAPSVLPGVEAIFAQKKNLRLLVTGSLPDPQAEGMVVRPVGGGFLYQSRDNGAATPDTLRVVTKRAPTAAELSDLLFAFTVAKHVKSNAIVYARNRATVGIGAGQMSRLDSTRIAVRKSADAAEALGLATPLVAGSVVASDAFFPFPDGLIAAANAGATAVIQPGGSIRDSDVIDAANERDLSMVFTGIRHFRH